MVRIVTRKVLGKKHRHPEMVKFQITGLSSGKASQCADMHKFNIEFDRGHHTDKKSPYRKSSFDTLGEHTVTIL